MADYKIFGQAIDKLEYTVPTSKNTVFSKITAHNTSYTANLDVAVGSKSDFDFLALDPDFPAVGPKLAGSNQKVWAIAEAADGSVFVGGTEFTGNGYNGTVIRYKADGTVDPYFLPPVFFGGSVYAIAIQPDGKILIGGNFTDEFLMIYRLARLNIDGTLDTSFDPNINGDVWDIEVMPNGDILIVGSFTTVDGETRERFAKLKPDGTLDSLAVANANSTIFTVAVQEDGKILLGGAFTSILGYGIVRLARLYDDGSGALVPDMSIFFTGSDINNTVNAILPLDDGSFLFGGEFTGVLKKVTTSSTLESFGSFSTIVNTLAKQSDGKIIVGLPAAVANIGAVARCSPDGTLDSYFNSDISNAQVVKVASGDKLLVGGDFETINQTSALGFAKLTTMPKKEKMYLMKNKEVLFDEKIEISGGVALEDGQMLLVQQHSGENFIINAYGVEI